MDKIVLAAASFDKEKYYMDEGFLELPESIRDEIKTICIVLADKLMCTFIIGFYTNGEVYFETIKSEEILDFDDIGAELEIKALKKEKAELIKALNLWYLVYKTANGEKIKEELLKK
ncbi:MAG TPA: hypothetical protein DIC60_10385 [Lachnospiraceae bacterium]|nr:hypothetical protein [Lachnospiraceae bacterium]